MNQTHPFALAAVLEHSKFSPITFMVIAAAAFFSVLPNGRAQGENSVGQLLKRLPPPEEVAKATGPTLDPAARDPLVKQIVEAAKAMNFGTAYALSTKLASHYPKSAGSQSLHGELALLLRRYSEASSAFHKAISIQPNFAFAYVGLGLTDASQNRLPAAMSDFKQVTRLSPNTDAGWIGLSGCAARMGQRRDSVSYAKQATTVAPKSVAAWLQLSRAENLSGDQRAASQALARANELKGKSSNRATRR